MLEVENLSVPYGKHAALRNVALRIELGRTVVILGANGAGKTTLLNSVAGIIRARPGARIAVDGEEIQDEPAYHIVEPGVALVPEGRRLFGEMTVLENLRMGAYAQRARRNETTDSNGC